MTYIYIDGIKRPVKNKQWKQCKMGLCASCVEATMRV